MAVTPDLIINTLRANAPKYEKGFQDQSTRRRFRLAMLRSRGRIKLNGSGTTCIRKLKFSEPEVHQYSMGQQVDFGNHNFLQEVQLRWASYYTTDSIALLQQMLNTGPEKLVDELSAKEKNLRESMDRQFNAEQYGDGSAAGRENAIYGIKTFRGYTACTATDKIAKPNDSYGMNALSTVLGNYGGTWSANGPDTPNASLANDYPNGQGTSEYDFNSPLHLNFACSEWNTTESTLWVDNCWDVLTQGILWQGLRTGLDPDLITLGADLFFGLKQHHKALRRAMLPHPEATQLGFGNKTANFDGCAIYNDFDCPTGEGFIERLEGEQGARITAVGGKLFHMKGPSEDPRSFWSKVFGYLFFGQCDWNPKHVAYIGDFTS